MGGLPLPPLPPSQREASPLNPPLPPPSPHIGEPKYVQGGADFVKTRFDEVVPATADNGHRWRSSLRCVWGICSNPNNS